MPAAPLLWIADVAPARDAAWAARHTAWLSPPEQARFERIARPERRAQFLAGHVLLRRLVAAVSGVAAPSVAITPAADGQPVVEAPGGWRASLAHSGRWVVALLDAGDAAPGVDIEQCKAQRDIRAIVLAACGVAAGSAVEAYLIWVQHEAELKAGRADADVWVATWEGHALAASARTLPAAALLDLERVGSPRVLEIAWSRRAPLPAIVVAP